MIEAELQYAIAHADLGALVRRFGGVLSPVVFDTGCELLTLPWLEGVLAYRRSLGGVAVVIGDPLCAPHDQARLLDEARARFDTVVVARASRALVAAAHPRGLRRWFFATEHERVVGVQSLVRLDGCGGYLLEHLLTEPDVPAGTTESLVIGALDAVGREGCRFVSFGLSTAAALGLVSGL